MFGLSVLNPWKWGTIGLAVALVASAGWGAHVNSLRADWSAKYTTLSNETQTVVIATQQATNNPDLKWAGVPAQITALASSNLALKSSINLANGQVMALNAETLRLKVSGDELRTNLATAQKARAVFAAQLDTMSKTPGDRTSCPALLSQAQDALDLAWSSGT